MRFLLLILLLTGCASRHAVLVTSGTTLGLQISENPASGLYEAKLGFARVEFAHLPTDTNQRTADVILELRYGGLLSREATLYQRLAVGRTAVSQPGAALLFAKGKDGSLDAATANAVAKALASIPTADDKTTTAKLPLAEAYERATDKSVFDSIAKAHGYASFSAFLLEPQTNPAAVEAIAEEIKKLK